MKKRKTQNKQSISITAYKYQEAVQILEERIADIPDVQGWASEVGLSRRWLCKSMKSVYGKAPKIILREMKYEKVVTLIIEDWINANCYSVAVDAGFGNAKSVSRFLSSFFNTNFTELKMDLLKGDVQIDFQWYNESK
jgi:AraC-like DNA-binding protein